MNPVEQFMNLVEELDYSGYSLTVFANVLTRVILERNGEVVSSQYLLDDSAAAATVPASVWVLPSRSAFPKAQLPQDGGAVSADAEAGHTERIPAEASGQEAREREVLIPTVALERWFTVFSDKTETRTSDADLFAEGAEEDEEESGSTFWGESLRDIMLMVAASVGPSRRKLTQSVSSSLEPEKLFQFFFAAQFKAIKERVDELASFWVAFGRLAKRIQATRRVRRLSVLTESEREAYTSRGARGVGDDGMGSEVFSASSMDALDDAVYQNEFLTTARVVKAEEETVKSAATEKCGRILNDLSRWFIQYFYASAVAANEPESRNHRILFSPEGMAGLAKGFVRLAVDFDRYPRMPVDELVHYARVRREQFRRLEQLWVAVARGDLAAVVTRKVTLENLMGDSSERESEGNDEDEEAHDVEDQESGSGWRSPLTASLTGLPEDTSVVPEAILASLGSRGAAQASADRRDWEVAEALDLVAEAQRARAAHAGGHAVEGTSPHTLLEGLRYAAVPEATAFSTTLHTVVEQLRSINEGGTGRHLAFSAAIRAELLESLVFPREVLPERSGLADVVPRVTPFSPLKEVALVLECLDARSPCQSALLPRGSDRTVEECVNAVPMSRERPCRRRYMGTDLMKGALATGRPEENLLTLLRSGRVLHLEFHNPMPVPVGIAEGYVCDCCGQNHLEMGYQARMYDNVRDDTTFYTACLGYDLCLPCAVYFFKRAFTRLTRALYPRSAPLSSSQGQWRADFYRPFAHGNGGSRVVVWSTVVRPVATAEAGPDASVVEIAMLVSVCPYAAQPVAWCLDNACEAGMVEAFQEHAASAAPESAAYLSITLERRAALPLPPFTWRSQCQVVSCTTDSHGTNAAGERAFASDETCPVCLGLLASAKPTLRTKCGHWFHVECLGQLPGSEATQGNDAGTVHSGYTDFLSVHETAPVEPAGQTSADADAATDTWEDVEDDAEEEEEEAPGTQASVGAACPMCRCKDYMPSMGIADVLARNTYRMTLQVRRREVVELASRAGRDGTDAPGSSSGCRVALASVISSDGQVHNYTNVASCQQLEVRFPQHFLDAAAVDGVPAEPVLMAYEEEGTVWQRP